MRRFIDKIVKSSLSLAMVVSSLMLVSPVTVQAQKTEYEIYPTPHKITYNEGSFIIREEVNVVYDSTIDEVTKSHLQNVLTSKVAAENITAGTEVVEGKTNILVGTQGSGEYVDTYINENYNVDASLFNHFGAYYFSTTKDEIVILGRDTDAAFYGVTSLKMIFNQIDGISLRHLTMEDYADVNTRGFIEGYYGIPWTNEDRMELMKFGGDIKMTSYIFAPKDDPYHKEKWREPYPADELERLKEMVTVGNETKCRFVWTAHPFMGGFDGSRADAEIDTLIAKFEHLYTDAGVRQFGVLGDDVGNLPRSTVVKMMQRVGEWAESKGDVYDVVFCPQGYNHSWQGNYSELNEYDREFPDNVQIFWTGEAVCQPIEQKTLDHFRNHNSQGGSRRAPLFWLNWPVNDINHSRMIMGHATKLLQTNINIEDLAGAVTNPMQESEPSKVAIFQLADYAWNIKNFDGEQSWKDSFKYIEPNASEEMYTLAKHMANPEPNGHGLVMPESEEIAPLLTEYKEALKNNNVSADLAASVVAEFEAIIDACDGFNAKSQNEEMKKDLAPFIASLKDLSTAIINFVQAQQKLAANDTLAAFDLYTDGQDAYKASATYTKPMLGGGTEIVDPGSTQLIPFAKALEEALAKPMSDFIAGEGNAKLEIKATTNYQSIYEGSLDKIIDGNPDSHVWYQEIEQVGKYFQIEFNIPQTVFGIHILNGTKTNSDTFTEAELKYQVEGSEEWISLGTYGNRQKQIDVDSIQLENVVKVRYECTRAGSNWVAMREFNVAIEPESAVSFTKSPIFTAQDWGNPQTGAMVDGDSSTLVHFPVRNDNKYAAENIKDSYVAGDFYGVEFNKTITLGVIDILQGNGPNDNDMFHASKLQYKTEDDQWEDIPNATFGKKDHIVFDASEQELKAKGVRLVATDTQKYWVRVREFDVDAKVYFNSKAYTNVEALKDLGANIKNDTFVLSAKPEVTLEPGQYVGVALDRIHEITNIDITIPEGLTLEVGVNEYQFETYKAGSTSTNARYIRLINNTEDAIRFDLGGFTATSKEFYPKSFNQSMSTLTPHDSKAPANLFDGDWTTQACFGPNQNAGQTFVYDLGQIIEMSKLKVVCRDSEIDFPRHAKISVSEDGETWTDIMFFGNQEGDNPGEATNEDNINDVLPTHETSYNTKEESFAKTAARYLKFEITRAKSGNNKWVRFQEFIINDGEYYPAANDPTYETNVSDTLGGEFEKMNDGNLKTYFIPNADKGSLTYHVSSNNDVNVVKVIQAKSPISNAKVTATVLENGKEKVVELGTLSQTVNEFALPAGSIVVSVTMSWDKVVPSIAELILTKDETITVGNKTQLEELLNEVVDTSTWTKKSIAAYQKAIANGQKVMDSPNASTQTVEGAVKAIQNAKDSFKVKGDVKVLEALLETKETDSSIYTKDSWKAYMNVVAKIEAAIADKDNVSVEDVEALGAEFKGVTLVYAPLRAEQGVVALESMKAFIASVDVPRDTYTKNSWEALNSAIADLEAILASNEEAPVNPNEINETITAMKEAKANLVSITALKAEIDAYDEYDASIYTEASFAAYTKAVDDAKALYIDGTVQTITDAIEAIQDAKANLQVIPSIDNLNKLLDELKGLNADNYTEESYTKAKDAVSKVETMIEGELTEAVVKEATETLQAAKAGLVSVEALLKVYTQATSFDGELYTTSTYNALVAEINKAKPLFHNGTVEQVTNAVAALTQAINNLEMHVSKDVVDEQMKDIVFDTNKDAYTKESYEAYKAAYDHLMDVVKNYKDVTADEFFDALEAFQTAEKNLVQASTEVTPKPETGDSTNIAIYGILMLACLAFFAATSKKKALKK